MIPGCAGHQAAGQKLQYAVHSFNDHLRWKRFDSAAAFLPSDLKPDFLERYLSVEDDLHVESIEVRAVSNESTEDIETAKVTVVAQSYLLPSNVLRKTIITETWELRGGRWTMAEMSRHLAPPLPESTPREAAPGGKP
jgi:hypothetical protein